MASQAPRLADQQLLAARTQTYWNIGILAALTLASIGACVYLLFLYEPAGAISLRPYLKEARERITANAAVLAEEAAALAADAVPPVAQTFYHQFRRDAPIYLNALEKQGDVLVEDLAADLRQRLKGEFKAYLAANRQVVAKEFPQYASQEAISRLETRFELAAERLIDRYYINEFRKEARRTSELWQRVKPVPPPEGDETLESQLLEYTADWALLKTREFATD
jgi:hypothetical protein